jgi:hypothetical protein
LPEAPVLLDVPLEELPLLVEGRFWLMLFVLVLFVVDPLTVPESLPLAPVDRSEVEVLQPTINAAAANIGNNFFISFISFSSPCANNVPSERGKTTGAQCAVLIKTDPNRPRVTRGAEAADETCLRHN